VDGSKESVAIILGSGFSCESGLPPTRGMAEQFLTGGDAPLDRAISTILGIFWKDVFGYKSGEDDLPSLEDHFTMLDLAANSGHHLGLKYPPKKLRALRRMSIHRVFQILDKEYDESAHAKRFLEKCVGDFNTSIITLNWDIVVEALLADRMVDYGIDVEWILGYTSVPRKGDPIPLFKVHGSANWTYCDACRTIHAKFDEKSALHSNAFLEVGDFGLFELGESVENDIREELAGADGSRTCRVCGNQLAGRLATFSYTKAFSIHQFQTIWERAYAALRSADRWIFVGYSMPQADYEFKHMLKSAQLGRERQDSPAIKVVLKGDEGAEGQYKRFFGVERVEIFQEGLAAWVDSGMV